MGLNHNWRTEPEHGCIDHNGLRLHYLEWNPGGLRPVLLLHGFTGHARVWDGLANRLRPRHRVIALDQRGHGESGWSPQMAYSIDDHLADIRGLVEKLSLNGMVLIGHSMGGRNALWYASCFPESLARLVIIDARPSNTHSSRAALQKSIRLLPPRVEKLEHVLKSLQELYPLLPRSTAAYIVEHGYREHREGGYIAKCDAAMGERIHSSGYRLENLWPFVGNITCPTLVIRGEHSSYLSREAARRFAAGIPDGRLVEIGRASHLPALENPAEFCAAVLDFIEPVV